MKARLAYYALQFALWCLHNPKSVVAGVDKAHDILEDIHYLKMHRMLNQK